MVPLKYQKPFVVVSNTKRPVAGEGIAARSAEVTRGIKRPRLAPTIALTSMSSMALAFGVAPLALMPMFCACAAPPSRTSTRARMLRSMARIEDMAGT